MRIHRKDNAYIGSRITGPTHNFLSLEFFENSSLPFELIKLPFNGDCFHGELDVVKVRKAISEGLQTANSRLNTSYTIGRAKVVENDSPSMPTYAYMALKLTEHMHQTEKV